jgi:tetratricopeptide (TPR) repeat protein
MSNTPNRKEPSDTVDDPMRVCIRNLTTYAPSYLRNSAIGSTALHALEYAVAVEPVRWEINEQDRHRLLALMRAYTWAPLGLQQRDRVCSLLVNGLRSLYSRSGDEIVLRACIEAATTLLFLRPAAHDDRARACADLALLLNMRYRQTKEMSLLDKAIGLEREALQLRPVGHPDRATTCSNLAVSLSRHQERIKNTAVLDETVELQREALSLYPEDSPNRAVAYANLAMTLNNSFEERGDGALLDEAIVCGRAALNLRPGGHPGHALLCGVLAHSLEQRFKQTGDGVLLEECITLTREALSLCPDTHLEQGLAYVNLAHMLKHRPDLRSNSRILGEAIELERQALELRPMGHPDRAVVCENLAFSLEIRYEQTGDVSSLDEAVKLKEDAFYLCPRGHPHRAMTCMGLAVVLRKLIHTGRSSQSTCNFIDRLHQEALSIFSPGHPQHAWCLDEMTQVAILHRDWESAMRHIGGILNCQTYNSINGVLGNTVRSIASIDVIAISHSQRKTLLGLYSDALTLVNLATGFALDLSTQLQHIHNGSRLGLGAFLLAIRTEALHTGLQLLERARGMIWSQTLHMRDPQLDDVPTELAERLRSVLRSVNDPVQVHNGERLPGRMADAPVRDVLYTQRHRAQELIRQIRSLPGLRNFMHGPSTKELLSVAARNFVVVLIEGVNECHALIITSADKPLVKLVIPNTGPHTLQELTFVGLTAQQRGSSTHPHTADRGLRVSKQMSTANARLAKIWRIIVKPIVTHLGILVRSDAYEQYLHSHRIFPES